ncbi:MAG: dephospho-CoA kinase, partial [Gammaproteobacteria bacterium]
VIDADQVAREVVEPGTEGLRLVVAEFGSEILDVHGSLDRPALRRIVFSNPISRECLESILHPLIRSRTERHLTEVVSPYCLLAIPLLVEKGASEQIHRILVVDCPREIQIARVIARDKLTERDAEAIIRTQATREQRLAKADDVITNASDLESVRSQVEKLHHAYLARAASAPISAP